MSLVQEISSRIIAFARDTNNRVFIEIGVQATLYAGAVATPFILHRLSRDLGFVRRRLNSMRHQLARQPLLQIIDRYDGQRLYAFIYFDWNGRTGRYRLIGFQHLPDGTQTAEFESDQIEFPRKNAPSMMFSWASSVTDAFDHPGGTTQIKFESHRNARELEGKGFFVTYDLEPKRYELRAYSLTRKRASALTGRREVPWDLKQRENFVRALHERMATSGITIAQRSIKPKRGQAKPFSIAIPEEKRRLLEPPSGPMN